MSQIDLKNNTTIISNISKYVVSDIIFTCPDGFTLDLFSFDKPMLARRFNPEQYMVSLAGYEQKYAGIPTYQDISSWLTENYEQATRFGQYVGGWSDQDLFYFDISIAISGLGNALEVARTNQQLAIYHPATSGTIHISDHILQATA